MNNEIVVSYLILLTFPKTNNVYNLNLPELNFIPKNKNKNIEIFVHTLVLKHLNVTVSCLCNK